MIDMEGGKPATLINALRLGKKVQQRIADVQGGAGFASRLRRASHAEITGARPPAALGPPPHSDHSA